MKEYMENIKFNSYVGDTLQKKKVYKALKVDIREDKTVFDAVIGNPPYSTDPSNPTTVALYNKFIETYIDEKMLLFVVPSRWFVGGKGLNEFRAAMLKRKDIVFITHEESSKKWFGNNINIAGGVNYFLKDMDHNGDCLFNGVSYDLSKYDAIIKPKYHKVIDIVSKMKSINKLYMGRYFGIETNDKRLKVTGKVKCYVSVKKSADRIMYLDKYDFTEENTFWKVITTVAGMPGFGAKFIGKPREIHSGSYISFRVNSEDEAKSLLSYLETPFANNMLSIRKISQHINKDVCKWIPLVPLDRKWTDDGVYKFLKIKETDLV
jgi:site-specific DNA-methyltransferase (adenine-specific)